MSHFVFNEDNNTNQRWKSSKPLRTGFLSTRGYHVINQSRETEKSKTSISRQSKFDMAMSKLLEKGLEAQVLNGLTRDNSKVISPQGYAP